MYRFQSYLKDKLIGGLLKFLKQGISPQKLALAISIGFLVGIFPILGTHTALSMLVIYLFRLNPASIFLITNLAFPLFFVFVIPFVRLGENIFNEQHIAISIESVYKMMNLGFLNAIETLGMTLVYAFTGWLVFSIPAGLVLYFLSLRPLRSLGKMKSEKILT